jgi:hypothetical protein
MDALVQIFHFTHECFFGCHYSYFENWCLGLDTGTLEDMLLTNFGVGPCKFGIELVLLQKPPPQATREIQKARANKG